MTRGRKVEKVPEFAEACSTRKGAYRCILCWPFRSGSDEEEGWIAKKSWTRHIKGNTHMECVVERAHQANLTTIRQVVQDEEPEFLLNGDDITHTQDMYAIQEQPRVAMQMGIGESDMWRELDSGQYKIQLDDLDAQRKQKLQDFERRVQEYNLLAGIQNLPGELPNPELDGLLNEGEVEDATLSELLNRVGISNDDTLLKLYRESGLVVDNDWAPYPSKLIFLLDAIDNIPRIRISSGLMKVILFLLEEVGVKGVPALSQLRDLQTSLRETKGVETVDWMSPMGNAYSFNSPVNIIAKDWSNPKVRPHLKRYPVLSKGGVVSEIWHGEKWRKTLDRHAFSPMYDDEHGRHYFIDEPARVMDRSLVVPIRWFEDIDGVVWFEGWRVRCDNNGWATIVDSENDVVLLPASSLKNNFLDLQDANALPIWSEETVEAGHPLRMPNPDRKLADGHPIYTSFIDVFGDDVSGNRSKSWNKHWNIYIKHRNLPRAVLQKDVHTHFISTSPHASVTEQFQGIKQIIEETHVKPVKAFDCQTGQEVRLKLQCNCEPGDNPAQSEVAGHIGGAGNHPCRRCNIGGTKKDRKEENGFHQLFEPGTPRTAENTLAAVKQQVETACRGVASHVEALQKATGVKDAYTQYWIDKLIGWSHERQSKSGRSLQDVESELKSFAEEHAYAIYNPFLTLKYSDVNQDTPVEILHTILLGVVKYSWHWTHSTWKNPQKELYAPRLQGTNTSGLSIPPIRAGYITQYANSLIGRQLKILVQTNTFHVHDLVNKAQYELIKATGVLSALLWYPEIRDMADYLVDLKIAIANVLDSAAAVDPSKIVAKMKFHILTHIPDDVQRLGPMVGESTESYESFNIIFRHCSILSNHLAPSRDIAHQLAKQETFKHFISGGWWMDSEWKQPGSALRKYASGNDILQCIFNFSSPEENVPMPGHVVLTAMPRDSPQERPKPRVQYRLEDTEARNAIAEDTTHMHQPDRKWYACKSVAVNSGDECRDGSWVFSRGLQATGDGNTRQIFTGRILQILKAVDEDYTVAVIERFEISQTLHPRFDMPVLCKPFGETSKIIVEAMDILFDYNVQHDCYTVGCAATQEKCIKQERVDSERLEKVINHLDIDRFVINTHAFHNAHRLRSVTSSLRDLLRPKLLYPDRKQHHSLSAAALRNSEAELAEGPSKKRKRVATTVGDPSGRNGNTQTGPPSFVNVPLDM